MADYHTLLLTANCGFYLEVLRGGDSENSERGDRPGYYVLDTFHFTENSLKKILNMKFHIKRRPRSLRPTPKSAHVS